MSRRLSVLVTSLFAAGALAVPAAAQLARPRVASADAPKLLVVPFQRDGQDSALSLLVADGVRERLRNNHLDKFNTFTRAQLNQVLTESGFPVDIPLETAQEKQQIVRFMNAKYLVDGTMIHHGDSITVVGRLSEATGTLPQSATTVVTFPARSIGAGTGGDIANRLVTGYNTFDEVSRCRAKLDAGDAAGALDMANRALRQDPNNSGAWLCIAGIREKQNAPEDSVIAALISALQRDTLSTPVMRRLAQKYEAKNDTVALLDMLKRILAIDVRDNELRLRTAQMMVRMNQADSAVKLVNQALAVNPASVENLKLKAVAEAAGSHWDSAYAALQTLSDIDTAQVDSTFLYRITNYARQIPDTTKWMTWVARATQKFPNQLDYWYQLATNRLAHADSAGTEAAARGLVTNAHDCTNAAVRQLCARSELLLALLLSGHGQTDSALVHADVATRLDTSLTRNIAAVYLISGAKYRGLAADTTLPDSVRAQYLDRAIDLLGRGKDGAAGQPRLLEQVAFQLGIAQFTKARQLDQTAETGKSCDVIRQLPAIWQQVNDNIALGAHVNVQIANQILTAVPQFQSRASAMARNNHCGS